MVNITDLDLETIKSYKSILDKIMYEQDDQDFLLLVIETASIALQKNIMKKNEHIQNYYDKYGSIAKMF
jgi:hypothetical protein